MKKNIDWLIIFSWLSLAIIGLIAIYSATQGPVSEFLPDYIQRNFGNQLMWVGISLVAVIALQFTSPTTFQQVAIVLYLLFIVLGILTIFYGIEAGGAKRWLSIGGFRLQSSEFLKLSTILIVAQYLTSRRDISAEKLGPALITVILISIPALIVLLQNDTGTALVILSIIPIMLFWSGLPYGISLFIISPAIIAYTTIFSWVYGAIAAAILALAIFIIQKRPWLTVASLVVSLMVIIGIQFVVNQVLQPYQQARIHAFVNPSLDPQGAGWNVMQAKTAIGSGGITGKGFMEGTQTQLRFLPEQWTDFIICVIAEEFGFIGISTVIFLFMILLMRLLYNAGEYKHPFGQLVFVGVVGLFMVHILINIGSATGLLPVIGLPLPFLSYGGSSFLANSLLIGICLNLYMYQREFSIYAS